MVVMYAAQADAIESAAKEIENVKEDANVLMKYLQDSVPSLISFGVNLLVSFLIIFAGLKLIKLVRRLIRHSLERAEVEKGVQQFIDSLVKYMLYIFLIIIIVGRFGVQSSSIIAVVGSAGLAVGLALQGSLANLAGGVIILLVKPFRVGDYIIAGEEGTVKEIELFYTKLLTVDNKQIMIPNGTLANGNIVNVTAQQKRRVDFSVGIGYTSDLRIAKEIMYELLENCSERLPEEEAVVFVSELADSAVIIGGRVWVAAEDYWNVKWALTEKIKLAFDEKGIEIPFQQVDVHITSAS